MSARIQSHRKDIVPPVPKSAEAIAPAKEAAERKRVADEEAAILAEAKRRLAEETREQRIQAAMAAMRDRRASPEERAVTAASKKLDAEIRRSLLARVAVCEKLWADHKAWETNSFRSF